MSIDTILINLSTSTASSLWTLIWSIGCLLGILTCGFALQRMVKANLDSHQPSVSIGGVITLLLCGAFMFNLKNLINRTWNTFGEGEVSFDAVSYQPAAGFGHLSLTINAVLTLVAVFGGIFFIKGVSLLKRGALEGQSSNGLQGGDSISRAITHMIGGAFLINLTSVLDSIYESIS